MQGRHAYSRWAAGLVTAAMVGGALLLAAGSADAQGKVQKVSKKLVDRAEDTLKKIKDAEKQLDRTPRRGARSTGRSVTR